MNTTSITRLAAVIVMIFAASAGNNITIKTITVEDVYDSFIYQDFVVEGTVESIVREEVHPQDLFPGQGGKRKIPMARIEFKVSKVLMGDLDKGEIKVVFEVETLITYFYISPFQQLPISTVPQSPTYAFPHFNISPCPYF